MRHDLVLLNRPYIGRSGDVVAMFNRLYSMPMEGAYHNILRCQHVFGVIMDRVRNGPEDQHNHAEEGGEHSFAAVVTDRMRRHEHLRRDWRSTKLPTANKKGGTKGQLACPTVYLVRT